MFDAVDDGGPWYQCPDCAIFWKPALNRGGRGPAAAFTSAGQQALCSARDRPPATGLWTFPLVWRGWARTFPLARLRTSAVSERTIRNWITSGKLSAEKSAGTFRIDREQLNGFVTADWRNSAPAERNGADSATFRRLLPRTLPLSGPAMLELVHLVAQLQVDVVQKAEAAAMWQTRAEFLASQLEQAQLALEAPKEPTSTERPFLADSEHAASAPTQTPAEPSRRAPWWMPWRRATS